MFLDRITLYCRAGDGGSGCLSFRRESHVPRGGPDGGDGGNGGNIVIRASENIGSLAPLAGHLHWNAGRGDHGQGQLKTGRTGDDVEILVPPGTLIRDAVRGHLLKDLQQHDDSVVIAVGGKGGYGNKRFATATNRAPREVQPGETGQKRKLVLELKSIADVGLIGKPNAGKSTLLGRLTEATPEIAGYPFTTRYPNLGIVQIGFDHRFTLADIPGLIEGAHTGAGLGHEFLRHVERTRVLVHLVEPAPLDDSDPLANYNAIRNELRLHDQSLVDRPELVVISKCELPEADRVAARLARELDQPVRQISAVAGIGLEELTRAMVDRLEVSGPSTVSSGLDR